MRIAFAVSVACAVLLTAGHIHNAKAQDKKPMRFRQYQFVEGKTLKDYIDDGYEVKAILPRREPADAKYFLQKGKSFVACDELSSVIGNEVVLRSMSCTELIQPVPY